MDEYDILDMIGNWFLNYATNNGQSVVIDTDGMARINGEFDLMELAENLAEELA